MLITLLNVNQFTMIKLFSGRQAFYNLDLICVISDAQADKPDFPAMYFPGLSDAVLVRPSSSGDQRRQTYFSVGRVIEISQAQSGAS